MRADGDTERDVLAAFDAFFDRFCERDLDGALATFAPEPDVHVIGSELGQVWAGLDQMRSGWARLMTGPRRYGSRWSERSVWAAGDIAWFAANGDELVEEASDLRTLPYVMSGVAHRRDGRWLLVFLHGSEPA